LGITTYYKIKKRNIVMPYLREIVLIFMLMFGVFFFGCGLMAKERSLSSLEVVSRVDINRYMGTWYEIARYPNRFQKDCLSSKATYSLREDGKIDVLNQCIQKEHPERTKEARGKAWVVDPISNAKLKVSFFWPFRGDYWIICLADDYSYAVVGHPKRKYIWILAHKPIIEKETYYNIIEEIVKQGYNPEKLIISPSQIEYLNLPSENKPS